MQDFIRDENLKLYRAALARSTDEDQRRVLLILLGLLVDEQAKPASRPKQSAPDPDRSV
ncbi:hypothetical protein SR870_08985 [Rhodopseudomonas palustris]|uniref:hypothetical protein n=1 Tax=Rhodopseudomonas palustris TaxID=1076 RepID=UPI002ACE6161|nr:hypothetical protein [Rhodopseudomonas palustris]WQH01383.1 hypothetical protein SR870_08985 [Rhodopseudomonas palustris]